MSKEEQPRVKEILPEMRGIAGKKLEIQSMWLRTIETNLVSAVSGKSDCEEINYCDLESITSLDLSGSYDPSDRRHNCNSYKLNIQERDFAGLTGLTSLDLSGKCLRHLS